MPGPERVGQLLRRAAHQRGRGDDPERRRDEDHRCRRVRELERERDRDQRRQQIRDALAGEQPAGPGAPVRGSGQERQSAASGRCGAAARLGGLRRVRAAAAGTSSAPARPAPSARRRRRPGSRPGSTARHAAPAAPSGSRRELRAGAETACCRPAPEPSAAEAAEAEAALVEAGERRRVARGDDLLRLADLGHLEVEADVAGDALARGARRLEGGGRDDTAKRPVGLARVDVELCALDRLPDGVARLGRDLLRLAGALGGLDQVLHHARDVDVGGDVAGLLARRRSRFRRR